MGKLDRCECVMYLSVPVSRALHTGLPRSNMYPKALTEVVLYLCAPFMKKQCKHTKGQKQFSI